MEKNKRILVFNVNWLGDVLFSTAAIRNIRLNYPSSYIACIVPSRCYQVLKDNPHLDEILIFDEKDRHKGFMPKLDFVRTLRNKHFDVAYLMHRSFSRALICRLARIPERIGYYTKKRAFLLTKGIMPPAKDSLHRIDHYLSIIEKAGLRVEDRYTEFFFRHEDEEVVEEFLKRNSARQDDFLVAINPAGNWLPKRWFPEYWAELADKLIVELGAKVIITGSSADLVLVNKIQRLMRQKLIVACGLFNLKQLGALCKRVDVFISADTGPLHIANAVVARKIIALFGPTDPAVTGPYPLRNTTILRKDVGCKIPCYVVNCKDRRCMAAIKPADVFAEVAFFKRNG
ncbi:MAG: lipopolysaccharide heptosyltransferase II [Candidatus Omnitrophica bacterium]|nr:lipopolysaccharide heptosyltransferase II [Candidatus Omnitrophota bacterium]